MSPKEFKYVVSSITSLSLEEQKRLNQLLNIEFKGTTVEGFLECLAYECGDLAVAALALGALKRGKNSDSF